AEDLFAGRVEFPFDVGIGGADTRVDPGTAGMTKGFAGDFDVFLHGAAQAAHGRVPDDAGDFLDRVKITGTGYRKTCLDDVYTKGFELERELDLFGCVEFATGDLFAVTKGGVEDENFLIGHKEF